MGVVISDSLALGTPNAGQINPKQPGSIAAPNVVNPQPSPLIAAPRLLTSKPDETTQPAPLTHARILYDNRLLDASSDTPEALTPNTFERVRSSSGSTLTFIMPENRNINSIAIGAGRWQGVSVTLQTSSDTSGSFTTRATVTPDDNRPVMALFSSESVRRVRVIFGSAFELGYVSAGITLDMQRPIYGGHDPAFFADNTEYRNSRSQAGQWLGRDIVRQGLSTSFDWSNLTDDWVRSEIRPFMDSVKRSPFFIAWRPADYPDEVAYCWTSSDPQVNNQGGGNKLMSFSLSVEGHSDR